MKKFKPIALGLLMILSFSFLFTGCGGNYNKNEYEKKGFIAVCSVEYWTGNNFLILNSKYSVEFETEEISAEKYVSLNYQELPMSNSAYNMTDDKQTPFIKNAIFKRRSTPDYFLFKVTNVIEKYIYIKVIDDNKIEIIDTYNSENFLINTPYYNILYFK